jgi:hypothetical protein
MLGEASGRVSRPPDADHDECDQQHHDGAEQRAEAGAFGRVRRAAGTPRGQECARDQACRTHRRRADVEQRLRYEPSLSVQRTDERRVQTVREEHAAHDPERCDEVRSAEHVRDERGQHEPERREHDREGRVHEEALPQDGLRARVRRRGDRAAHALNPRRNDRIVGDASDRKRARERAVTGESEQAGQRRLLDQAGQEKVELRARDGESTAAGFA